jgi:hypothetical protein
MSRFNVSILNLSHKKIINKQSIKSFQKIQSLQSKIIRKIANAPYYLSNVSLHNDLKVPFVRDLVTARYNKFHSSLSHHSNPLVQSLSSITLSQNPWRFSPRDDRVQ